MVWKIEYLQSAQKEARKIDPQARKRIKKYLEHVVALEDPRQVGKALKGGLSNLWRYRIGDYRVICELRDDVLIVLVVTIGHRKNVYKKNKIE